MNVGLKPESASASGAQMQSSCLPIVSEEKDGGQGLGVTHPPRVSLGSRERGAGV